jgi:hypothetical protein
MCSTVTNGVKGGKQLKKNGRSFRHFQTDEIYRLIIEFFRDFIAELFLSAQLDQL